MRQPKYGLMAMDSVIVRARPRLPGTSKLQSRLQLREQRFLVPLNNLSPRPATAPDKSSNW